MAKPFLNGFDSSIMPSHDTDMMASAAALRLATTLDRHKRSKDSLSIRSPDATHMRLRHLTFRLGTRRRTMAFGGISAWAGDCGGSTGGGRRERGERVNTAPQSLADCCLAPFISRARYTRVYQVYQMYKKYGFRLGIQKRIYKVYESLPKLPKLWYTFVHFRIHPHAEIKFEVGDKPAQRKGSQVKGQGLFTDLTPGASSLHPLNTRVNHNSGFELPSAAGNCAHLSAFLDGDKVSGHSQVNLP
ncbi:hypothetical protein B0H19DRAFT_1065469 [Mycena capillaripes]|nr:hypothetical protein B0H19DRAFT_1065469 [Mycena capillaripes]